jgi:hypothetical protein
LGVTIATRSVEVENLFDVQSQQSSEGKAYLECRREPRIQTSQRKQRLRPLILKRNLPRGRKFSSSGGSTAAVGSDRGEDLDCRASKKKPLEFRDMGG